MEDQKVRDLNAEALESIHGEDALKQYDEEQKKLVAIVQNTFNSDWGEQCLAWLEDTYANQPSFDPNNARLTDFNEGCRHVVLTIKTILNQ